MTLLVSFYNAIFELIERVGDWLLPLAARFVIGATLLVYYWHSGLTKLGDGMFGIFSPTASAYVQILDRKSVV